jgi:methionine synthase I (cobalamin-dependent)
VQERVVIYDGAMGTNIRKRNPTVDDYWGRENCNEVLVLSRPDIIREIHADFSVWAATSSRPIHFKDPGSPSQSSI